MKRNKRIEEASYERPGSAMSKEYFPPQPFTPSLSQLVQGGLLKDAPDPIRFSGAAEKTGAPNRESKALSSLRPGETGIIAYIKADDAKKLQKLMAMGVLPGNDIVLDANFPSFVFTVGFSQYAVDADMAAAIIVN